MLFFFSSLYFVSLILVIHVSPTRKCHTISFESDIWNSNISMLLPLQELVDNDQ